MMRKGKKIALIVAAGLVLAGCAIGGSALAKMDFDVRQIHLTNDQEKIYPVDGAFTGIDVRSSDGVTLEYAPSKACAVVCRESPHVQYSVAVEDGVLTVQKSNTRRWYECIGIWQEEPTVRLLLPENAYDALTVNGAVGDVEIPQTFTFVRADIRTDTGDVRLRAQVHGALTVQTDTGDVTVADSSPQNVTVQTDTGDVEMQALRVAQDVTLQTTTGAQTVRNVMCRNWTAQSHTGDMQMTKTTATGDLRITTDTGDVTLDACDASSLDLRTDTGDVTGTLLTDKVFQAHSDTGSVQVPQTMDGGLCRIESDTGDINVRVEP